MNQANFAGPESRHWLTFVGPHFSRNLPEDRCYIVPWTLLCTIPTLPSVFNNNYKYKIYFCYQIFVTSEFKNTKFYPKKCPTRTYGFFAIISERMYIFFILVPRYLWTTAGSALAVAEIRTHQQPTPTRSLVSHRGRSASVRRTLPPIAKVRSVCYTVIDFYH